MNRDVPSQREWLIKQTCKNWGRRLLPLVSLPLAGLLWFAVTLDEKKSFNACEEFGHVRD